MGVLLPLAPSRLAQFCATHRIRRLSLFGSVLKGGASANSDMDLLVEFNPGESPGLIGMASMESELSALMGRRVDMRAAQDLSKYFRDEVMRTAKLQYAQ